LGEQRQLHSSDGFSFGIYQASPPGVPEGAVVVIQEIFGVNNHIREICDGYAEAGYVAIAPQIFDRVERDIDLGYEESDMTRGISLAFEELDREDALRDLQETVEDASQFGKVAVVGYCFGGLLSWLSACELSGIACAVPYYGGGIAGETGRSPRCPVIMHFGELDAHIPLSDVEKIRAAQPDVPIHVYDADHGFNCDHRDSYNAEASATALTRTLAFFAKHLA